MKPHPEIRTKQESQHQPCPSIRLFEPPLDEFVAKASDSQFVNTHKPQE